MTEGVVRKSKLISFVVIVVFASSMMLLSVSVERVRKVFAQLADVDVALYLREPTIQGLELTCEGELRVSSKIPFQVEILQVKLMAPDGETIGNRALEGIVPNKTFLLKFQNSTIFQLRKTIETIKYVGFARVKFDIGRYGLKLDFPLSGVVTVQKEL